MIRTFVGIFLILHGLAHAGLAAAPIPNDPASTPGAFFTDPSRSRILSGIGFGASGIRITGIALTALATLGFAAAGMGLLGVPGFESIWRGASVISAVFSLLLFVVFWHPWLVMGLLINIGILIALLFTRWPSTVLIGL